MKPLSELIDEVGNAKDAAREFHLNYDVNSYAAYQAGHRAAFDILAPALKEAISTIEELCPYKCNTAVTAAQLPARCPAHDRVKKIRAILEGRSE